MCPLGVDQRFQPEGYDLHFAARVYDVAVGDLEKFWVEIFVEIIEEAEGVESGETHLEEAVVEERHDLVDLHLKLGFGCEAQAHQLVDHLLAFEEELQLEREHLVVEKDERFDGGGPLFKSGLLIRGELLKIVFELLHPELPDRFDGGEADVEHLFLVEEFCDGRLEHLVAEHAGKLQCYGPYARSGRFSARAPAGGPLEYLARRRRRAWQRGARVGWRFCSLFRSRPRPSFRAGRGRALLCCRGCKTLSTLSASPALSPLWRRFRSAV